MFFYKQVLKQADKSSDIADDKINQSGFRTLSGAYNKGDLLMSITDTISKMAASNPNIGSMLSNANTQSAILGTMNGSAVSSGNSLPNILSNVPAPAAVYTPSFDKEIPTVTPGDPYKSVDSGNTNTSGAQSPTPPTGDPYLTASTIGSSNATSNTDNNPFADPVVAVAVNQSAVTSGVLGSLFSGSA